MAHVSRPTYTRAIPMSAEPCEHRGKPAVRWKGRNRKWVYGIVCKDGRRCLVESSKFRIFYTDHENRPASTRGYSDRSASEHRMQELVSQSERIHSGLLDPRAIRPRLSLTELLDRWHAYIEANGATTGGARRERLRAGDVCDGIGAVRVSDLSASAVLEWIDERRRANRHKKRAFGPVTAANYLGSCKSFTRWCALVEKCEPIDHLSALKRHRPTNDLRVNRRALSESELKALLLATKESEAVLYGLTGQERHALYLFACSTGFRASECASLTRESFNLSRREVTIQGSRAKNRKTETLPLDGSIIHAIKPLLGNGPLWPNRVRRSQAWWMLGARMLRFDLEAAGIPFEVNGWRFDFHALRGQFATDLDRAGVSLARGQKLMRHSDPKLTSRHYNKPEREELALEVGKLKRGRR